MELYLKNCYLKEFDSIVKESFPDYVVLEDSAFYPESGGQPGDKGFLTLESGEKIRVSNVKKEKGISKHYIEKEIPGGTKVHGVIDWEERHAHMRMHTAQHILSAIILDEYGAETAGNQIHADFSRIDFRPLEWSEEKEKNATEKFNEIIKSSIPVEFENITREEMMSKVDEKRRKLFERLPSFIKQVRMINIEKVDLCPCAGTHVKNTSEIGRIKIIGHENKGSGTVRIKFELLGPGL